MGAQWKHSGRLASAAKKGSAVGKLVKEIIVAAKLGDPNPENNARLRAAVEAAKKQSVTRDTIERAIKKGSGQLDEKVQYDTVVYEGFAPHQVPVIVECLTDNKNRTAADVRMLFRDGQIGNSGSVAWMFERLGVVEATHAEKAFDLEEAAIESGAQEVENLDSEEVGDAKCGGRFYCDPTDLNAVTTSLENLGFKVLLSELSYQAKNKVQIADENKKKEVVEFLEALDDNDDVHRIYTALE